MATSSFSNSAIMIRRAIELEALFGADVRAMRDIGDVASHPLDPAEASVVARAMPARRAEFAAGRACAHAALADLGAPYGPLLPGPDRSPLWPVGFVGSITHTRGACAAVVAPSFAVAGVGLDVEPSGALPQNLLAMICQPEERSHHAELPQTGPDWALLTFCAKEAFYKAYRPITGQFLDFLDVSIHFLPGPSQDIGQFQPFITDPGLPLADRITALTGHWRQEAAHLWAAFTWPAE